MTKLCCNCAQRPVEKDHRCAACYLYRYRHPKHYDRPVELTEEQRYLDEGRAEAEMLLDRLRRTPPIGPWTRVVRI
ncbi:MAG TPA: hypothetical protein VNG12_14810 [Acidimicrobiales bacterium]|nr:hypothetical protein [Acidimicrobiales bacterium]